MANEARKKTKWIILLIFLVLLILAILSYLYFFYYQLPKQQVNTNQAMNVNQNTNASLSGSSAFANLTPEQQQVQIKQNGVLFYAMPFAERFGTYSNQGDFANFDELKSLMTTSMFNWVKNTYIPKLEKEHTGSAYYGIDAKAISSKFNSLDEDKGSAEVLIKTQRREYVGSDKNPKVFYQDIVLKLVKSENQWKVDGAYWQK
jgi:hypothetical protein